MIETREQFISAMTKHYGDIDDYYFNELNAVLDELRVSGTAHQNLYSAIMRTHKYNSFPKLYAIRDIWLSIGYPSNEYIKKLAGQHSGLPVKEICRTYKKYLSQDETANDETQFLITWGDLAYCVDLLTEKLKWDERRACAYCEPLKRKIEAGEKIDRASFYRQMIHDEPKHVETDNTRRGMTSMRTVNAHEYL